MKWILIGIGVSIGFGIWIETTHYQTNVLKKARNIQQDTFWEQKYQDLLGQVAELLFEHKRLKKYFE